ncbi:MAG: arsenosugar biosynthesis-associated peroxidase-like protein [Planctomycetota bacterium]
MREPYTVREDLARFAEIGEERGELFEAYQAWSEKVFQEGALTSKTKHLIAMAVAHALQCSYCIDAHTSASASAGANLEEITEAIHVAAVIRGGASLVHGVQALDTFHRG